MPSRAARRLAAFHPKHDTLLLFPDLWGIPNCGIVRQWLADCVTPSVQALDHSYNKLMLVARRIVQLYGTVLEEFRWCVLAIGEY